MPIDYPPNGHSPIHKPTGWKPPRLQQRFGAAEQPKSSLAKRIWRGLFIVGILALAGLGATTLVTLMGLSVLVNNLDRIDSMAEDPLPDQITLALTLNNDPDNHDQRPRLTRLFDHDPELAEILRALDTAMVDKRVKGLLVRLNNPSMSLATAQELRDAVKRFRTSGKTAQIFTTSFGEIGGGMSDYYLATAFDKIWLQPTGVVGITGLHMEGPYFGGLLEKLGVSYQVITREEYKSAMENMSLRQMSPPAREMMNSLLDDIFSQIVDGIAADRKLTPAQVRALIDDAPIMDRIAVKSGLVDQLGYRDEVLAQAPKDTEIVDIASYHAHLTMESDGDGHPEKHPKIALINGYGVIMEGADGRATPLGRGMEIEEIADAMDSASEDPEVRAIILRLNTPGGSPTASEYLRRTIIRAKNAGKPVIVSMGEVTASGGYWIASAATKIVAQPGTLTGSIGVVAGKPTIAKLSDKYQVGWTSISRGENAALGTLIRPYTAPERRKIESIIDNSYQSFLERVAEGRKMDKAAVRALAKGRVWTGRQAHQNGLVDALGGIDVAIAQARIAMGTDANARIDVVPWPGEEHGLRSLIDMAKSLGVMAIAPIIAESFYTSIEATITDHLNSISGIQARMDYSGDLPH